MHGKGGRRTGSSDTFLPNTSEACERERESEREINRSERLLGFVLPERGDDHNVGYVFFSIKMQFFMVKRTAITAVSVPGKRL